MSEIANTDSNSENVEWLIGEPLDTMQIKLNGKNGVQQVVPALHIGFMEVREFLHFKPVPIISNDTGQNDLTAEEEEWLECISFFEDDLHWLLRLPHHRFWSQVVYDENLQTYLESYLTLAPRDYDKVNMKMREEIRSGLMKIHRLVFLVFLRMSTYKESKMHHIRPKTYGDIIYDNYVFDIPTLMDLCVLYGFQNKALVTKMVKNIFKCQPKYLDDLNEASALALNALSFAEEKLFLNAEKPEECCKLADNSPTDIKDMPLSVFSHIISYITDTCATMYIFLEIYSPACRLFYHNGAIGRFVGFYEQTFQAIEKEIKRLSKTDSNTQILDLIKKKVTLAKSFILKIFRNILSYVCIQHILDPDCKEERFSHLPPEEEFLDIFMEIACEKIFLHDYNLIYPFDNDMELVIQSGIHLDPQRVNYVFECLYDTPNPNAASLFVSTADNGARPKIKSEKPTTSVKNIQSVAAILKPEEKPIQNGEASECNTDSNRNETEVESLILYVKEIIPDVGDGFVEECLKYYNYKTEKLIDDFLNKKLPPDLDQLDRKLVRAPKPVKSSVLSERKNIFDDDEFDVFSRNDVDMKKIHIGKKNKTPDSYQNLDTEEESEFLKNLICTYGDQESDDDENGRQKVNLYEDEYDDTYDSALVGLKEPILDDEPDDEPVQEETKEEVRDHRKEDFCINPEILRQKYEERRESRAAARGKGKRGGGPPPNSSQNRSQKDRNKAYVGNHNRRNQSDYKKSRGMVPFPTR